MKFNKYGKCPECNADWDGGLIFDSFRADEYYKDLTDKELQKKVESSYGEPYKWSRVIGIEDPMIYDGVSWWMCPDCKAKWDRWTGELQ